MDAAVRHTGQFYKVDDRLYRRPADQLGLAVLLIGTMTNPNYGEAVARGHGLKNLISRSTATGNGALRGVFARLYDAGVLKMEKYSTGHDRFVHSYFLFPEPNRDVPNIHNLTVADVKSGNRLRRPYYIEPKTGYGTVAAAAVRDRRLTVSALGVLAQFERLSIICAAKGAHLFKDMVRAASKLSGYAFNLAWKLLFQLGYLTKTQRGGREKYLYFSHESVNKFGIRNSEFGIGGKASGGAADNKIGKIHKNHTPQPINNTVIPNSEFRIPNFNDRAKTLALVRENVGYDFLAAHAGEPGLPYLLPELNGYVALITEVICDKRKAYVINGAEVPAEAVRERFLALDARRLLTVMDRYREAAAERDIKNRRQYKIACLYNELTSED